VRQLTGRKFDVELFKDDRTAAENTFSFCCTHGQVQAGRISQPPTPFDDLLTAQTPATNQFMFVLQAALLTSTECGRVHHCMGLLHFLKKAQQGLCLLNFTSWTLMQTTTDAELSHDLSMSSLRRARRNAPSAQESRVYSRTCSGKFKRREQCRFFRVVISANKSDMADPRRRYNATVASELNVSILRGIVKEVIKILTMHLC